MILTKQKRVGFKLAQKDVFLNIAGGLKVNEPAIDLPVISAILSSNMDAAIEPEVCMAGEIGLSGEIRPVNRIEQRIGEAEKLGFKRFLCHLVIIDIVFDYPIRKTGYLCISVLSE